GNGASRDPSADASGELIVFHSEADDLVLGDNNQVSDIFLRDLALGQTTRLTQAAQASANPALDAEGETLLYDQDTQAGQRQVLGQMLDGTSATEILSLQTTDAGLRIDAHHPAISADGRFVVYLEEVMLEESEESTHCQVHLYDRSSEVYHRQACPAALAESSEDGRAVFSSEGNDVLWHLPEQMEPLRLSNPLH
ncbi:MAG: TolB family protein, partial [Halochromatium sp.]